MQLQTSRRNLLKLGAVGAASVFGGTLGSTATRRRAIASALPTWSTRASMPSPRLALGVAATGGKIYAIGGTNSGSTPYFDALDIYDTSLDVWTSGASMSVPRWGVAAAAVYGKVYAIGGFLGHDGYRDTVEVFDPVTNAWSFAASLLTPRMQHAALTGRDNKIYVIGGWRNENLRSLEVYDPLTDTWEARASMPTGRYGPGVAQAPNGKIYVIGGTINTGPELEVVEAYDPESDTWETCEPLPTPRGQLIAATGADGNIYAIGGWQVYGTIYGTTERFDPLSGSWTSAPAMPTPRYSLAGVCADNDRIYAIGGFGGASSDALTVSGAVEELDLHVPTNPVYVATVQSPIRADGKSVFNANRGNLPVKFELAADGQPTCMLPQATIAVYRLIGATAQLVNPTVYTGSAGNGSSFVTNNCQYHYQLAARTLGIGRYRVDLLIDSTVAGSAYFELK